MILNLKLKSSEEKRKAPRAAMGTIAQAISRLSLTTVATIQRHQRIAATSILLITMGTIVGWTLLLPLPQAHGAYTIQKITLSV